MGAIRRDLFVSLFRRHEEVAPDQAILPSRSYLLRSPSWIALCRPDEQ